MKGNISWRTCPLTDKQSHTRAHAPLCCVVVIILGLSPDPAPQLTGSQPGPLAVLRGADGDPARLATSASAPAAGGRLTGAGFGETGGGAEQAVQEVADGGRERSRLHILVQDQNKNKKSRAGLQYFNPNYFSKVLLELFTCKYVLKRCFALRMMISPTQILC